MSCRHFAGVNEDFHSVIIQNGFQFTFVTSQDCNLALTLKELLEIFSKLFSWNCHSNVLLLHGNLVQHACKHPSCLMAIESSFIAKSLVVVCRTHKIVHKWDNLPLVMMWFKAFSFIVSV
uniref:ORF50 n=1 Tax=Malaco herpesvirus 1 TaxID=3031797 RepID=A0AA48SFG5_9VIRU|nr:TPA_asm: ORF50 [Malaco herpesvirus 1]